MNLNLIIPELGHLAMILALCLALVQATLPLIGAWRGDRQWMSLAVPAAWGQFAFLLFAFLCLTWSFMADDFSVAYVASNSNSALPWYYKFSAVWGAHEGSLLLWAFILAGWTFAVAIFSRQLPEDMLARVLGVMGLISIGFLLFLIVTSNPFERLLPQVPMDGRDLNPLLQDFGLIVHPPMLYMGYVGFSVAFAFAIAALLGGRLDAAWARWSRPWTLVAWAFLGLGIALGSWWAYYELGWGGWWFWDPVENASFMPWLVGTALMHSLAVTEKRGSFKAWTALLAILAFSLSLLGTFIVRSGVLSSVHAFATDPERGLFILVFFTIVVGGSLTLFAWRAPKATLGGKMGLVSRESMLLANSVLLVVATAAVLLGTVYPLIVDALNLGKLSVGAPYFNAVFVPLMVPVVFLMVPGGVAHWREARWAELAHAMRWPALAAVLVGLGVLFFSARGTWLTAMGMALATWVVVGLLMQIFIRMKKPGRETGLFRFVAVDAGAVVDVDRAPGADGELVARADGTIEQGPVPAAEAGAWRRHSLHVDGATVGEAIAHLRRYHGGWIVVTDGTLLRQRRAFEQRIQAGAQVAIAIGDLLQAIEQSAHRMQHHHRQTQYQQHAAQQADDQHIQRGHAPVHQHLVHHHLEEQGADQGEQLQEQRDQHHLADELAVAHDAGDEPAEVELGQGPGQAGAAGGQQQGALGATYRELGGKGSKGLDGGAATARFGRVLVQHSLAVALGDQHPARRTIHMDSGQGGQCGQVQPVRRGGTEFGLQAQLFGGQQKFCI